jgi:hypothetical protein
MRLDKVTDFACPHCHKPIMVATHIDDSEPSQNTGHDQLQKKIYSLTVETEIQAENIASALLSLPSVERATRDAIADIVCSWAKAYHEKGKEFILNSDLNVLINSLLAGQKE